jgi:hypothetical protein
VVCSHACPFSQHDAVGEDNNKRIEKNDSRSGI